MVKLLQGVKLDKLQVRDLRDARRVEEAGVGLSEGLVARYCFKQPGDGLPCACRWRGRTGPSRTPPGQHPQCRHPGAPSQAASDALLCWTQRDGGRIAPASPSLRSAVSLPSIVTRAAVNAAMSAVVPLRTTRRSVLPTILSSSMWPCMNETTSPTSCVATGSFRVRGDPASDRRPCASEESFDASSGRLRDTSVWAVSCFGRSPGTGCDGASGRTSRLFISNV